MKKKIIAAVLICICIVSAFAAGCTASQSGKVTNNTPKTTITAQAAENNFEFITINTENYDFVVYREKTTDVLYVFHSEHYKGGLTVMMDPQTGGPLTYKNWKNNYKNK